MENKIKMIKSIPKNFDPDKAFFVIDSDNLQNVRSALYGFCIIDDMITDKLESLADAEPSGGAYIHIKRNADTIIIKQDFIGTYGVYLYQDGDYFALSNSFIYLVDYVKTKHRITFNKSFADQLLTSPLTSYAYSKTMINEISLMDRSAVIELNIPEKMISWHCVDYKENTVDLDSAEGMEILDRWYRKWTGIVKSLFDNHEDITFDLSGGFDSRIVFLLALGSGVDLNKLCVISANDNLHTHAEDYEIASQIAEHFGFALNNSENITDETDNYSVEDILNMCWYIRSCFHKENTSHYGRFKKSRYRFSGYGGECLRDYLSDYKSQREYSEKLITIGLKYHFKDIAQIRRSIENIMGTTFDEINRKFKGFGRPLATFNDSATMLYRETRNRNHFGKGIIEHYYSNAFVLSPLLDADLHRLKLYVSQDKKDKNALYAVLFERYCSKLLDFKFEGNREFTDSTIQNVKAVNRAFPYVDKPAEHNVKIDIKDIQMNKIEDDFHGVPAELMRNAFLTTEIKNTFLKNYNEEAYSYISEDSKKRSYFPLRNVFPLLGICKIIKDISSPDTSPCSPADFIIDSAAKHKEDEAIVSNNLSLRNHELIDIYITGRFDIKNEGSDDNYIELLEISDLNAAISSPVWLNKNGNGYVIQSQAGSMSIKFRCAHSGMLVLRLKARDIRYKDKGRIPVKLDYKKFVINGEVVFDTIRTASHDKPFKYTKKVSDGDVISIETEWIPYDIRKGKNIIRKQQELIQSLKNKLEEIHSINPI